MDKIIKDLINNKKISIDKEEDIQKKIFIEGKEDIIKYLKEQIQNYYNPYFVWYRFYKCKERNKNHLEKCLAAPLIDKNKNDKPYFVMDFISKTITLILYEQRTYKELPIKVDTDDIKIDFNSLKNLSNFFPIINGKEKNIKIVNWEIYNRREGNYTREFIKINTGAIESFDKKISSYVGKCKLGNCLLKIKIPKGKYIESEFNLYFQINPKIINNVEKINKDDYKGYKIIRENENDELDITIFEDKSMKSIISMLAYATNTPLNLIKDMPVLTSYSCNWANLFFIIFLFRLEEFCKWLKRNYIMKEEDLNKIKGKLNFKQYIKNFATQKKQKISCVYSDYSYNTIENQIIYYTFCKVRKYFAQTDDVIGKWLKEKTNKIAPYFANICYTNITLRDFNKIRLSRRIYVNYEEILKLCKSILEKKTITMETFEEKDIKQEGLFLDMVSLFEECVRGFLKKNITEYFIEDELSETLQKTIINKNNKGKLLELRPDIIMRSGDKIVCIGDTKYKNVDSSTTFSPISREDFYQVFTYLISHEVKTAFVIYPTFEAVKKNYEPIIYNSKKGK